MGGSKSFPFADAYPMEGEALVGSGCGSPEARPPMRDLPGEIIVQSHPRMAYHKKIDRWRVVFRRAFLRLFRCFFLLRGLLACLLSGFLGFLLFRGNLFHRNPHGG
jgi:hypothetical protein